MKVQENLFCLYFSRLLNPKQSAVKAGFDSKNAEEIAFKLLQRKDIRRNLDHIFSAMQNQHMKMKVIAGLENLAFGSINDSIKLMFSSEDLGKSQIDELDLVHISEIKRPKDGSLEIKFCDRFKALEKLLDVAENFENNSGINDFYGALMQSAESIGKQDENG